MDIPLARSRADGVAAVLIVLYAAVMLALVLLVSVLLDGTALLVVLLVLVVAWLLHVAGYLYAWSRLRKVAFPIGVHGDGVHDRVPVSGEVVLPWDGIASATLTPRLLRSPLLRVRPADAGSRGITYSLRILDVTPEELRQLFSVQSGGRVQLT